MPRGGYRIDNAESSDSGNCCYCGYECSAVPGKASTARPSRGSRRRSPSLCWLRIERTARQSCRLAGHPGCWPQLHADLILLLALLARAAMKAWMPLAMVPLGRVLGFGAVLAGLALARLWVLARNSLAGPRDMTRSRP